MRGKVLKKEIHGIVLSLFYRLYGILLLGLGGWQAGHLKNNYSRIPPTHVCRASVFSMYSARGKHPCLPRRLGYGILFNGFFDAHFDWTVVRFEKRVCFRDVSKSKPPSDELVHRRRRVSGEACSGCRR